MRKRSSKVRRAVLRLRDLDHSKAAVLNSLGSPASRRAYEFAIDDFIAWYCSEPRLAFGRIVVTWFRMSPNPASLRLRVFLRIMRRSRHPRMPPLQQTASCRATGRDSPDSPRKPGLWETDACRMAVPQLMSTPHETLSRSSGRETAGAMITSWSGSGRRRGTLPLPELIRNFIERLFRMIQPRSTPMQQRPPECRWRA
jgi:hypothetical protein